MHQHPLSAVSANPTVAESTPPLSAQMAAETLLLASRMGLPVDAALSLTEVLLPVIMGVVEGKAPVTTTVLVYQFDGELKSETFTHLESALRRREVLKFQPQVGCGVLVYLQDVISNAQKSLGQEVEIHECTRNHLAS